jgi:hypothetical protein
MSGVILSLMIAGWTIDVYYNIGTVKTKVKPYPVGREVMTSFAVKRALSEAGKKPGDFQAILALPMFHVGSEKFWLSTNSSLWQGLRASYETGLPMIDGYMGRIGLSKAMRIIQLISNPKIEKEIIQDLPS